MTVTEMNHGRPHRRRTKKQLAHVAALAQLPNRTERIRYACEHMAGGPATVHLVRAWLSEHDVPEDPADTKGRPFVSKIVNEWRRNQDPNPTGNTPITPDAAVPGTSAVHPDDPAPAAEVDASSDVHKTRPPSTTVTSDVTSDVTPEVTPALIRRAHRLRVASYGVLAVVAVAGAVLSYTSLQVAAAEVFSVRLSRMFPFLVDALIVGASLAYLAGATLGRGRPGWRLTAHGGVGGTLFLNALAANSTAHVPWHIAAPLVWSVIVELTARDLLGDHRQQHTAPDAIPVALWLTAPGESLLTWLRVRREAAHATARLNVGAHAAAREALSMALPGWRGRKVRRIVARQLRAGSLSPGLVLEQAVAIMGDLKPGTPRAVLRDVLAAAVTDRQSSGSGW